jgi:hypothetical protein
MAGGDAYALNRIFKPAVVGGISWPTAQAVVESKYRLGFLSPGRGRIRLVGSSRPGMMPPLTRP